MSRTKTWVRFFTIADFTEEEIWLREQHRNGWRLQRMVLPCFYIFEECPPEDVVYRLDYQNNTEDSSYYQILQDYGWDYAGRCSGWLYFRRPAAEMQSDQDGELFSDLESRIDMIDHVIRTRLVPILLIFLGVVLPNLFLNLPYPGRAGIIVFFGLMAGFYVVLITHCGLKLRRLREECMRD